MRVIFTVFWSILLMMLVYFIAGNINGTEFNLMASIFYGGISGLVLSLMGALGFDKAIYK